jgi:hypothetical protein
MPIGRLAVPGNLARGSIPVEKWLKRLDFRGGFPGESASGANFFKKFLPPKPPPLMVFALSTATIRGILQGAEGIVPPHVSRIHRHD